MPCIPRLWILPPCSGGLRRCHVFRGSRSCLPAREGSDTATCPTALDPASLLGRASMLPRVLQLYGPQPSRIKKGLDGLPMWQDSRVSKACTHVIETPDT
jgi:hypothetical protein